MKKELEILEAKFKNFLNQTIIGASKDYYKKQKKYEVKELQIIDDENYEEYLKEVIKQDISMPCETFGENDMLNYAYELLSNIEKTVIFLYFHENYKIREIAKILNMNEDYIGRLRKKALLKLKNYMEGANNNE